MSLIDYRLAWARNYLKNVGAIENSERGVWSVTEAGRRMKAEDLPELVKLWKAVVYKERKEAGKVIELVGTIGSDEPDTADDDDEWKEVLLDRLMALSPTAFEKLAVRILLEAGFKSVEHRGQPDDKGIDGVGIYQLSPLVSFPVYFQCKRYQGSVGPSDIRDLRGAMSARGERGLLLTTGTFTKWGGTLRTA